MHRRLLAITASVAVAIGTFAPAAGASIYKVTMQPPSCDTVNVWGAGCTKQAPGPIH